MKNLVLIMLFSCVYLFSLAQHATESSGLFPIKEGDRYGFINEKGEVIVAPKFRAVNRFSEGLVAVREAGHYGYLDISGNYVIPPIFDYGAVFSEGKAVATKDGQPYYIDKTGKLLFGTGFSELNAFQNKNGLALVKTATDKFGIINTVGELVVDTLFAKIRLFDNGLAIVDKTKHDSIGVVDSMGNFLVPLDRFYEIKDYSDGVALVYFSDEGRKYQGFIDEAGKLLFSVNTKDKLITGNIHDGLASISFYNKWKEGYVIHQKNLGRGYINKKGEVVIRDSLFERLGDFSCGVAIVETKAGEKIIIDKQGNSFGPAIFDGIINSTYSLPTFKDCLLRVYKDNNTGIIDNKGNYIVPPKYDDIDNIRGKSFFFSRMNKYKFVGEDGIVLPVNMDKYDSSGFQNGLLSCEIKGLLTYINKQGIIVWQEQKMVTDSVLTPLYIDHLVYNNYYAKPLLLKSDEKEDRYADARPKRIQENLAFPENELSIIFPDNEIIERRGFAGRRFLVGNNSDEEITFPVQDAHLFMRVQAKNTNGKWQDLEYFPHSWCGNSYYNIDLAPKHYWVFEMPLFEGVVPTELRVALDYYIKKEMPNKRFKRTTIYSSTFKGSINPGQLWRKGRLPISN